MGRKLTKDRKKYLSWAVADARRKLKLRAVAYKGGACQECGYSKCPAALQFHHLDPKKKDFGLGGGRTRSWVKVKPELDKTVMLCSNCHHELHYEEDLIQSRILEQEIRKLFPARKPIEHGNSSRYTAGCRCDLCKAAHAKRIRDYKVTKLNGRARAC